MMLLFILLVRPSQYTKLLRHGQANTPNLCMTRDKGPPSTYIWLPLSDFNIHLVTVILNTPYIFGE
jgi:hypothetical protein